MKKAAHIVLIFVAGALTYGLFEDSLAVAGARQGRMGGEVLIVPLIIILIMLGKELGKMHWRQKESRTVARNGFKAGYDFALKSIAAKPTER